jgi:16S rRNA G966 N2-methylase RsmD
MLALEAWSRGASVVVVERDKRRARRIDAVALQLQAPIDVVMGDVTRRASGLGVFDLVLVDPPYADSPEPVLEALVSAVGGRLVLEQPSDRPAPAQAGLVLERTRTYGGTALHLYAAQGA